MASNSRGNNILLYSDFNTTCTMYLKSCGQQIFPQLRRSFQLVFTVTGLDMEYFEGKADVTTNFEIKWKFVIPEYAFT